MKCVSRQQQRPRGLADQAEGSVTSRHSSSCSAPRLLERCLVHAQRLERHRFTSRSPRFLASFHFPQADARRMREKLATLAEDPRQPGTKKLKGSEVGYRMRPGDYRAKYTKLFERDEPWVARPPQNRLEAVSAALDRPGQVR